MHLQGPLQPLSGQKLPDGIWWHLVAVGPAVQSTSAVLQEVNCQRSDVLQDLGESLRGKILEFSVNRELHFRGDGFSFDTFVCQGGLGGAKNRPKLLAVAARSRRMRH